MSRVEAGSSLVEEVGSTMLEVKSSVQRVSDIVGEIAAGSREQMAGVSQAGEEVCQMDQTTQQNAALVEESAAAAESLRQQADTLVGAVSVFRIGQRDGVAVPGPVTRAADAGPQRANNVARPEFGRKSGGTAATAGTGTDGEWASFRHTCAAVHLRPDSANRRRST